MFGSPRLIKDRQVIEEVQKKKKKEPLNWD